MFKVISCLAIGHDLRQVVIAAVICCLGAVLTMRLFSRVRRSEGARRTYWLFLTAVLGGGTIWTTHFVAMLGYILPFERAYDARLTIVSLFVAIASNGLGFAIAARQGTGPWIEIGGAIVGLGIAIMHYTGIMAMEVPGHFVWDPVYVAASVVLGATFAAVATSRIARPVTRFCKYGGAVALTLAIVSMHFTGMAAFTLVPDATIPATAQAIPDHVLVAGIVAVMLLIMATGGSTYMIDHHASVEAVDRYRHLAMHDPLTGLPNRAHLSSHLATMMHAARDATSRMAIVTFDLDRFKDVNDVHGHAAGDMVLKTVAMRLGETLKQGEFLARIGGDEFVAIKPGIFSRAEVIAFAERIRAVVSDVVPWEDKDLSVGTSVGAAVFPDHGAAPETLLTRADLAMYRAKSLGRDQICIFDETMDELVRARASLAIDLRQALVHDELELYFQPQNDTATREIIGFEALLRWKHPLRGMVSPAEFIPIAEETGLILDIGAWVLKRACAEAMTWPKPYKIGVNVAASQLSKGNLPALVHQTLLETGLPAARLEIEITESGIIADQQQALHVIRQLKALGVSIAMDDYGTGYSSLATLQNFPFDKIKIDRSFIDRVTTNRQSAAIVKATIILGSSLDIPVLAEGVETEDHIAFLIAEGCNEVQGFFFGKPMPRSALHALLAAEKSPAPLASVDTNGINGPENPAHTVSAAAEPDRTVAIDADGAGKPVKAARAA